MNFTKGRVVMLVSMLLIVAGYLTSGAIVSAQVSAAISGRVEDVSGASIPGVTVTVTDTETGVARTAATDAGGSYQVLSLAVGRYDIRAEKQGFKAEVQTGTTLVVGQQAVVNIRLEIGEMQQSITVSSEVPVVNTTTAPVSGLVGEEQVKDLPLNGRSFDNLITLNPGAVNYSAHQNTAGSGKGSGNVFGVDGRRPSENLFLLNGVELTGTSLVEVTPGGASGQLLGIDAVREFNLVTDAYSAQYGKRPGGQVVVVTQSGSNQLHGTVFEFMRNSSLDARNYFDAPPSQLGRRIPVFQRNQFGGSLGGPIRKDKVFIFGNYEGFRQRLGISNVAVVPDNNARQGLLPNAQGIPTKVAGLNAGMLPFFQLWPQANGTELGGGLAINLSSPKQSVREDFGTTRVDENFSSRDTLSEIYTVDDGYNNTPQQDPLFIGLLDLRTQVASLQETHIFSGVINTFRFGYSRASYSFNVPPVVAFPASLSMFAGKVPGQMSIGGSAGGNSNATLTAVGSTSDNNESSRNLFTYSDDLQLIKGKHQISFGAWFQRLQDNRKASPRQAGQASFTSLTTFLQGTVSSFQGAPNPHEMGYRMLMGAWYAEDNITLRRNLTLRVGLRHEFTDGWNGVNGRISNFVFDPNGVYETNTEIGKGFTTNNAKWLFGPRVGLAWDVFGNGKTAIRSGFGTHYDLLDAIGLSFDQTPPFNSRVSLNATSSQFLSLIPVPTGTPGPPACGPGVPAPCSIFQPNGTDSNGKTATVEEWNLSVEQQITPTTVFRIGYVGSHGYHELGSADRNSIHPLICSTPGGCVSGGLNKVTGFVPQGTLYIPVVATRPNPYLGSGGANVTDGTSSYNALEVDLTQRLSKGLQFRANYTWSKNMDIQTEHSSGQSSNGGPGGYMEAYNPKADWGPSGSDATNVASISAIYDLPIGQGKPWLGGFHGVADKVVSGWQVNSIVTLISGLPFTALVGSNQSGDGDGNNPDRPSLNPAFNGSIITGNPNQWYNPQAFILPVSGTWGNVGRDTLRGPGLATLDMSLFKNTTLTERYKVQFRTEVFNVMNRANFSTPNPSVFAGTAISPTAGLITSTATFSREIQFGLKLIF